MPLDYTDFQTISYQGKDYIFNPDAFGMGWWSIKSLSGKATINVTRDLNRTLNKIAFGYEELPTMADRFRSAETWGEKERLKKTSLEWLQTKVDLIKAQSSAKIEDFHAPTKQDILGGMFFYVYDPKLKAELPLWDKYPLVIILEKYQDGFLGLNLHYLPIQERVRLLLALLNVRQYDPQKDRMKIAMTYKRLKSAAKNYAGYEVCLKRYLISHVKGKLLYIRPHEWGFSIFLPIQKFYFNTKKK